ncbi:TetR/AcrR family transcriptional regulator [Streptomyces sp. SID14515]|uniref:TetR/AcrR family transcriptional regulator n=1 Tax=Streptomyces sp. SID14515 TaxID=2706074 RepID=UPI0013C8F3F3|nr:TetR/AcrR family transcriptional regulator [Streptomyces sp. SID14515]NEB40747.1 TetR/AcrR family transcriptional regulator [Streptomyces sp. SID14515]
MSVQERKERERAGRERLIVATARELAEQQGWDAVTTRRLAERIEYSQPVLYSHFRGKREIIGAVALEGAAEMAGALRAATVAATTATATDGPRARVVALARAYLDFAADNPAVYDAMFQLDGGLAFAQEDTPEPLKDAFAALLETLGEAAGGGVHPALFTELFWASLHGLATLTRAGRLPPEDSERRVELLVDRLAAV